MAEHLNFKILPSKIINTRHSPMDKTNPTRINLRCNKRFFLFFFLLFILAEILIPSITLAARHVTLKNIFVANTRDDLVLYFTVDDAFTETIKEALLKGVPASFSFFISIYRKNDAWLDQKVVEKEIFNTLKYNALKQEFTLNRPWESSRPFITDSMEQATAMMCDIYNLAILPLERLEKGEQYQIRIKAEMNRNTESRYLQYVSLFISLWNFKTDWHKVNIIY
ncbi:conserved hypothetical protein [Desulfamplus magnetovallimortis]|uniref:DUF4390 domain-containing protein n=1 Tax=Desulfamplus magnetovallimortis TaxID=1246637 RepID=A0A1W1H780_9BACT|nr:DUF4390 domain-containing protein [Desulfamplus magnetovallimortis]SLM28286.1 conserved hypothetical protein [Desulfamplus magnetovallimortis]